LLCKPLSCVRIRESNEGIAHIHISPLLVPDREFEVVVLAFEAGIINEFANALHTAQTGDVLHHDSEDFPIGFHGWLWQCQSLTIWELE